MALYNVIRKSFINGMTHEAGAVVDLDPKSVNPTDTHLVPFTPEKAKAPAKSVKAEPEPEAETKAESKAKADNEFKPKV